MSDPTQRGRKWMPIAVLGAVVLGLGVWWAVGVNGVSGNAVGSANGPGGCNGGPTPLALDAVGEEELIDAVYLRLTDLAASDSGLTFDLGDVETYTKEAFGDLRWGDMATVAQGRLLTMTRHVALRTDEDPEVIYYPKWIDSEISYEEWDGKELGDWTVTEVLERAADSVPDASEITHLSTVRVDGFAYGKARVYRAAFLWMGKGDGGNWRVKIVDNITQGLAEVMEEEVDRFLDPGALDRKAEDLSGDDICATDSAIADERAHAKVTTAGYRSGETLSEARLSATCSCLETCVSVCKVNVEDTFCGHNGSGDVPAGWSMSFMATIVTQDGVGIGEDIETTCSGTFGCIRTQCPYGLCQTGVRISTENGQLRFAHEGSETWSAKDEVSATCPPCGQEGLFQLNSQREDEYEDDMEDQEEFE